MPYPAYRQGHTAKEHYTVEVWHDDVTGVVIYERWKKEGGDHRIDGAATIHRHPETGIVTHEAWLHNGQLHRSNGPAIIDRNPQTGKVTFSAWYHEGQKIKPPNRARSPSTKDGKYLTPRPL